MGKAPQTKYLTDTSQTSQDRLKGRGHSQATLFIEVVDLSDSIFKRNTAVGCVQIQNPDVVLQMLERREENGS